MRTKKTKRLGTFLLALIFFFVPFPVNAGASEGLFSLQEVLQARELGVFSMPSRLQGAGGASFTVVEVSGNRYLQISERTANWNAVDIHREGLYIGDTIAVTGFASNPPSGVYMILGGAESPWNWAANTAVTSENPDFAFNVTLTEDHFEEQFVRFRVGTNDAGAEMDFYIADIVITRTADSVPHAWHVDGPANFVDAGNLVDGERALIFDMAQSSYVQENGVTTFAGFDYLSASGSPIITRENGSLVLTERSENWHTVDVNLTGLTLGATYLFVAAGTAEPGMQIGFHRSEAPWNFIPDSMVNTNADGTWEIEGVIGYPVNPLMPAMRIQTNNAPNSEFTIDTIRVYRIGAPALVFETLHEINASNFEDYADYLIAGSQMEGTITPQGFRLENITGDYTSGNGNYLRLNLPAPIMPATDLRVSWDVYVPSAENPGERNLVGPGLVINSNFGQAPSQPTNDIDLNRTIEMDEWVTTTTEFMVSHEVGNEAEHFIFRFRVNNDEQQPTVLYIDNILIEYGGVADFIAPEWDLTLPSLAEAFEPFFTFGNIYPTHAIMNQFETREAFLHHFNAITAENWHKPDHLAGPAGRIDRPTPEEFNFDSADAIIDFAIENDLQLIGHAFVWHGQSPAWLFGPEGDRLTRAEARDNMEFYIRTLSEHFEARGVIEAFHSWDVVNEVIASGGGDWGADLDDWYAGDWRTQMRTQSGWWEAYSNNENPQPGEHPSDFVYDAFVFARRYFPNSILYYNDYNEEIPAKRNAIAQMVEQLNERWAHDTENNLEAVPTGQVYAGRLLIEGLGLQSHFHYPMGGWSTNFDNIRPALERFAATGAVLAITELDITVGAHGQGATAFQNLPEEYAQRQAEAFARLFGYYLEFADYIERVSIWGLADNQSWRATGHPVLFDSYFNAKSAFFAILDTVNNWETTNVQPVQMPTVPVRTPQEFYSVVVIYGETELINVYTDEFVEMEAEVRTIDGEIYVPVRPVAEALGFFIEWDRDNRAVDIYLEGEFVTAFYAEHIDNGRTLAPISLFEYLGVELTIISDIIEFYRS